MNRRTNLILSIFITLLILSGTVGVYAQSFPKKALASVSEERARNIVGFLADDLLEGRDAGMKAGILQRSILYLCSRSGVSNLYLRVATISLLQR